MVTFCIAKIKREFSTKVFFLFTNIKQIYTAMWYSDGMHQRVLSIRKYKKKKKTKKNCNVFVRGLWTDYFKTTVSGLVVSKIPHVRQSHAIKHVYIMACHIARPKDLWRAIKRFWDIITKVAPKVHLQLWRRSHWPCSGVSEECSKSENFNGGLPVPSPPIAVFRSKLPKGLGM